MVAVRSDERFVAAWESNGQDGDRTGVFFRRFDAEVTLMSDEGDPTIDDIFARAFPTESSDE